MLTRRLGGEVGDRKRIVPPIYTNACSSPSVLGGEWRRWIIRLIQEWVFSRWACRRMGGHAIESIEQERD